MDNTKLSASLDAEPHSDDMFRVANENLAADTDTTWKRTKHHSSAPDTNDLPLYPDIFDLPATSYQPVNGESHFDNRVDEEGSAGPSMDEASNMMTTFRVEEEEDDTEEQEVGANAIVSVADGSTKVAGKGTRKAVTFAHDADTKSKVATVNQEIDRLIKALGTYRLKVVLWLLVQKGGPTWAKAIRVEVREKWKLQPEADINGVSQPQEDGRGNKEKNSGDNEDLAKAIRHQMKVMRNDSLHVHKLLEEKYGVSVNHPHIRQEIHGFYVARGLRRARDNNCENELAAIMKRNPFVLPVETAADGRENAAKKIKRER